MENKMYKLPDLPYGYKDLEPYISEEQLRIHHDKHHQAYVDGANGILTKFDSRDKEEFDVKVVSKELTFHVGGFVLHNYFWSNMGPASKYGGEPLQNTSKRTSEILKDLKKNSHRQQQELKVLVGRF